MSMPQVRDKAAAIALIDAMIGTTDVGSAGDEVASRPTSPEVRAHLAAALGDDLPGYANEVAYPSGPGRRRAAAFAAYLRSVADAIDPPATT